MLWAPHYPSHITCWLWCAVPEGLKYADSHEWAKVEGDVATIGISDFAQVQQLGAPAHHACSNATSWPHMHGACSADRRASVPGQMQLGDVVYVELPEPGTQVTGGETFGVVESVKVRVASVPGTHAGCSAAVLSQKFSQYFK